MTAAAIVLVLATLLIHYSHCKAEATFAHLEVSTRTIQVMKFVVKRQDAIGNCTAERVAQFFGNWPQVCQSGANIDIMSAITTGNQTGINAAYRIICQPRCGNPLLSFYDQCGLPETSIVVRGFCARTNDDMLCYEQLFNILNSNGQVRRDCIPRTFACATNCQISLQTFANSSRCCVNALNNSFFTSSVSQSTLDNELWSNCNIDTPGFCIPLLTNNAG